MGLHSLPGSFFDLRRPNPQIYGLYGQVNGKLQEGLCQGGPSGAPRTCGMPLQAHAFTGGRLILAGSFGLVSCGVTAPLLWVLVHAQFCLCPPKLESIFPSPL